MTRWFLSLQFRLVAGFAVVLVLTLGAVSAYIGYSADRAVERLQLDVDQARSDRIQQIMLRSYSVSGNWESAQAVAETVGKLFGRHIVVADIRGRIVGDSQLRLGRPWQMGRPDQRFKSVRGQVGDVGSFLVQDIDGFEEFPEPRMSRFVGVINRSLIYAGIAAGLGGLLVVSILSRRTLTPVRALSTAARRLGGGDLSQRVPAPGNDEVGQLGHSFNSMAAGLEKAEQQRKNLVADVAHELRTPLSNIQGYVEAMRDGVLEHDQATLDTVHAQTMHLGRLVEDLRLLAQTESEDFRLNLEQESLGDVLRHSVEGFRARSSSTDVGLNLDIPDELPMLLIDRTRISQVLGNLLENAVRHSSSGGEVNVVAGVSEGRVVVTVADGGDGIAPEDIAHVFDRFYRADPSRTRATGGAGLGLTIAKKIVEAHGGEIRAESVKGQGSRFIFELPVTREGVG
jgi:signal transduction histidine kinase